MDSQRERSTSARKWWLLVAGIVVIVVTLDLLESLVGTAPTPSEEGAAPKVGVVAALSPAPPEVHRLDDGGIEIRHDFFRRTTIRLGNEDEEQALFDCLAQGIETTFGDGTEGWSRQRVRSETQHIQDKCLGSFLDLPVPVSENSIEPESGQF